MRNLHAILLTSLLLLAYTPCRSGNPSRISADFRQEKTSSIRKGTSIAYGHLLFVAPDYVKWEYTSPKKYCWESTSGKNNVFMTEIVSLIKNCMTGNFKSDKKFRITRDNNRITVTPLSSDMSRMIKEIVITLDSESTLAESVTINERNGNKTLIVFSNIQQQ